MNNPRAGITGLQALYDWFPTLEREERQDLHQRIRAGATGGPDFFVMMVLASMLASLGLLQGATAVVIGAMLVAPLMGPLLGAGLALVQGNLHLMRNSLSVALLGVAVGLGISMFFGVINPGYEPTMEVEARGRPDVFDLFVAFASGMVAAYAQGRPNVSGTLAGVAIAAALLPPLAVVGIAATTGELEISANAAVLLITNLVAIVIGAALVFRLLGVQARSGEALMPAWARRTLAGLVMIAVALMAPLLLQGMEKYRTGQTRPASYPVAAPVREAVHAFVAEQPSMVVLTMARLSVEPESGITIVLSTLDPVPLNFRDELRKVVGEARGSSPFGFLGGDDTNIRIFIMQEAPILIE